MKTIVLLSCVSKKKGGIQPACNLYAGPLFQGSWEYAKALKPTHIHIMSAKYGLIDYSTPIEKYDVTLNNMTKDEIDTWSEKIFNDLKSLYDLDTTLFIILAGKNYYSGFIERLPHTELPLGDLPIGKRVQWLQRSNRNTRRNPDGI
jgi:cytoplasmic iron level regulating protein YaaA (DUF328/UPF0246 family)